MIVTITLVSLQGHYCTSIIALKLLPVAGIATVAVIAVVMWELLPLLCRISCYGAVVLAVIAQASNAMGCRLAPWLVGKLGSWAVGVAKIQNTFGQYNESGNSQVLGFFLFRGG